MHTKDYYVSANTRNVYVVLADNSEVKIGTIKINEDSAVYTHAGQLDVVRLEDKPIMGFDERTVSLKLMERWLEMKTEQMISQRVLGSPFSPMITSVYMHIPLANGKPDGVAKQQVFTVAERLGLRVLEFLDGLSDKMAYLDVEGVEELRPSNVEVFAKMAALILNGGESQC